MLFSTNDFSPCFSPWRHTYRITILSIDVSSGSVFGDSYLITISLRFGPIRFLEQELGGTVFKAPLCRLWPQGLLLYELFVWRNKHRLRVDTPSAMKNCCMRLDAEWLKVLFLKQWPYQNQDEAQQAAAHSDIDAVNGTMQHSSHLGCIDLCHHLQDPELHSEHRSDRKYQHHLMSLLDQTLQKRRKEENFSCDC